MRSVSRSRRTRTLEALALLVLLGGSLSTIPVLDRVLLVLLSPARVALDLAGPGLATLGAQDPSDVVLRRHESGLALDLAERMSRAAQPQELTLPSGVRAVEAEVLARPTDRPDALQVLLADPRGLRRGSAVVFGDVFLGSLTRIPSARARGRAGHLGEVRLLTARDARVSGLVGGENEVSPRLVVGGIQSAARQDHWYLAVHNPQDEGRTRGMVLLDDPDPLLSVANGWQLGRVALELDPVRGGQRVAGLEPLVDHEAGLARVLVLSRSTEPAVALKPSAAGEWVSVRRGMLLAEGQRAGFPLLAGSLSGLRAGAAVADDQRLVGRVIRAAPLNAMVRRIEDPGCSVNVLAVREGDLEARPFVLGRIVSRGLDDEGRRIFDWPGERAWAGNQNEEFQLWTLAGEAGVPGGLLLGRVTLPSGVGPHVLTVTVPGVVLGSPPASAAFPSRLRVFINWEASQ